MMFRRKSRAAAAIAAVALVAAACGGGGDDVEISTDPLKLGYLLPETGQLAFLGPPMISGVQLALQEINEAGGVLGNPVELLSGDEAGDAGRAAEEATRLLAAGVRGIVGAAATGMTVAVLDQITSAGVVQCSPSNTGIRLTRLPDKGFYFRTAPSDVLQAPVLAELVINAGYTSIAVTARADDYGVPFLEETAAQLEARGATVTIAESYDPDAGTFDSVVDAMLGSGAEAFVIISFVEGAQIVQGLLAAGVSPTQLFGADGIAGAAFADNFPSASVLEGMRFTAPTAIVPAEFEARLLAFNPSLVDFLFAPNAYDCTNLIALSAVAAGSTASSAIRDQMIPITRGDNACGSFAECKAFLDAGQTIAYQSAAGGPLNFIEVREGGGEPSRGIIETSEWRNGQFVSTGTVAGDL
jgi:branched-chain amino acid transport system substrate-binding protein